MNDPWHDVVDRHRDGLLGLDEPAASARARELGLTVRVLRPGEVRTMEYRVGRVNLLVEDGRVTDVTVG